MKFDGWRLVAARTAAGAVELWSRHGTDLTSRFPEIAAAAEQLPAGTVIDGEVCVYREGRLDWDQLQHRMGSAARVAEQVRIAPASYVVFDVLALSGTDVRSRPWSERRNLLEGLIGSQLTAAGVPVHPRSRRGRELAAGVQRHRHRRRRREAHNHSLPPGRAGLGQGQTSRDHRGGHRRGHRGSAERPESVVAGRFTRAGQLVIAGRTTALNQRQAAELAASLTPVGADQHPWPPQISGQFRGTPVHLVHVAPVLVAEVSADAARQQSGRWRHPLRFVRVRVDLVPADLPFFLDD